MPTPRGPQTWRRSAVLALFGALGLLSCTSRTVPLPPPAIDSIAPVNAQGLTLVRGTAEEGTFVGVLNESNESGVIVTSPESNCDACPFEAEVRAEPGDTLRVWQFRDVANPRWGEVPDR